MRRLQKDDGLARRIIRRLTPSLVGQELSRLFGFGKTTHKARFGVGIGIEDRRNGMAELLNSKPPQKYK